LARALSELRTSGLVAIIIILIIYINTARSVCDTITCRRIFWTYTFLESLCFGIDGSLLCFHWFILTKNFLIKKLTLKIYSAASTGSHWKCMIVRGLYSTSTTQRRKLLALEKVSRHPGFSYVPQVLPFLSNCAEDDLRSKSHLPWQSIRPKGRRLIVSKCIYYRLFLSHRNLYVEYSPACCMLSSG